MTAEPLSPSLAKARAAFEEVVKDIRPQLHRYCARMIGSVIDAEDIVQDTLAKAYYTLSTMASVSNLEGWLFRIAHNKAIDYLRRYDQQYAERLDDHPPLMEQSSPLEEKEITTLALSVFLKLAPMQRSCVLLKDVMGYSLAEISELHDASVSAVKAALHRGRTRLRMLSRHVEDETLPLLAEPEASLLATYVDRFNARDFDAVRAMLADDVRLDVVNRSKGRGVAEVGGYFHRYSESEDWHLARGFVEGRLAVLVYDPREESTQPIFFMLIEWADDRVAFIHDYRYARYVTSGANLVAV